MTRAFHILAQAAALVGGWAFLWFVLSILARGPS